MKIIKKSLLTKYIIFLIILLVFISQTTKTIAQFTKCNIKFFTGFGLKYVENKGLAFGLLSQTDYGVYIGLILHIVFVFYMCIYYRGYISDRNYISWSAFFGFVLVVSGAIGSIIDRALLGCGRDFFVIPRYAVVNLDDICLTIGAALIIIDAFRCSKLQKEKELAFE